jgi:hypothetical protein
MESGGRFLKYAPPAGADTLPVARGQWRRSERWPHGTVALAYGRVFGWLGPAHILREAGPWTPEQAAAAREHRVLIGMRRWMVWIALGRPIRSSMTSWSGVTAEEWTYPNGTVDIADDKVSAIRLN